MELGPAMSNTHSVHKPAEFSRQLSQCLGELWLFWEKLRGRSVLHLIPSWDDTLFLRQTCCSSLCTFGGPHQGHSGKAALCSETWTLLFFASDLKTITFLLAWTFLRVRRQTEKLEECRGDKSQRYCFHFPEGSLQNKFQSCLCACYHLCLFWNTVWQGRLVTSLKKCLCRLEAQSHGGACDGWVA